jgi:MYXO-CTERM domain-containing protein
VLVTANAQTATDTSSSAPGTNTSSTHPDDRRGFDYGWLGLIGLAGLLELRKRAVVNHSHSGTGTGRV